MLFEEEAIKFIDFDYDIFIPDVVKNYKKYKLLDSNEFIENSIKYKYSPKLIEKINESVKEVKEMIDSGQITKFFKFKYIDSQKDKKDGKK
jgi:protein associated with RNAse G/E